MLPCTRLEKLFAAEPRRQVALALGGAVLDLAVELVDLLQRVGLGRFSVRLGLALGLGDVPVDRLDLIRPPRCQYMLGRTGKCPGGFELTAWSTLAPTSRPSWPAWCSASVERCGTSPLILAATWCASPKKVYLCKTYAWDRHGMGLGFMAHSQTASRLPAENRRPSRGSNRHRPLPRGRWQGVLLTGTL